jgi:NADPH:quinone reductase-like Zn-dependent oxidoreductase
MKLDTTLQKGESHNEDNDQDQRDERDCLSQIWPPDVLELKEVPKPTPKDDMDKLALKPANFTFEEAGAAPTSALAALHALRDVGKVQPGQQVLINGASGGIGTANVPIAKALGAEATGVCSTTNVELVRSIGADQVIDYTQQDFTEGTKRYDLIFDNVENRFLSDCRRALTPSGTLILNSGTGAQGIAMLVRLLNPLVLSPFVRQKLRRYLSVPKHEDLVILKELAEAGKLTPVIDRKYPLHETPAALGYIERGHVRGKVVITVEQRS